MTKLVIYVIVKGRSVKNQRRSRYIIFYRKNGEFTDNYNYIEVILVTITATIALLALLCTFGLFIVGLLNLVVTITKK